MDMEATNSRPYQWKFEVRVLIPTQAFLFTTVTSFLIPVATMITTYTT
jgi:hypothetical protein